MSSTEAIMATIKPPVRSKASLCRARGPSDTASATKRNVPPAIPVELARPVALPSGASLAMQARAGGLARVVLWSLCVMCRTPVAALAGATVPAVSGPAMSGAPVEVPILGTSRPVISGLR
ncbi:hypothetical protein V1227_05555 [Lentzea sp. DG1S-22]|uniref:hypothetical protein n=1 Tax=Lentzea sp. DG1S-22 TaxID=3108822 RepID=UPI002E7836B5|nr:hypothetical protein [Lentzea sp. DG1S-22]WVH82223.1 hypothetical protein V1227_05555 [Lentzea sp. DG1S-22]